MTRAPPSRLSAIWMRLETRALRGRQLHVPLMAHLRRRWRGKRMRDAHPTQPILDAPRTAAWGNSTRSADHGGMAHSRRFQTHAEMGCRWEVRQIADLRADEHIASDVHTNGHATADALVRRCH